jgi:hypothetical protein
MITGNGGAKYCSLVNSPDERKTVNNIRMELSRRLVKLGLQPDILSKLIFVVDRGTNIVCALQLCIKLRFPYDQYCDMLRRW